MGTAFFTTDYGQGLLKKGMALLSNFPSENVKAERLSDTLRIIASNAGKFDGDAASNVEWIGKNLEAEIDAIGSDKTGSSLDELYASFYRFVSEYELTLSEKTELSFELRAFVGLARQEPESFSPAAQQQIRFANHGMPLLIMKRLLGSELLLKLRDVSKYSASVEERIAEWDKALDAQTKSVVQLKGALKEYENAFNFVGLHKGFDDLAIEAQSELKKLRRAMLAMGVAALIPIGLELFFVWVNADRFDAIRWALFASSVPVLSATLLLVYYFRLAVRAVDGAKSQVLQLELRKTLCRFIQSYAEYAKKLKEGGAESLTKFESIIFSGIVTSEEKMPATFDGVDQLAKLVKAVKAA